MWYGKYCPYSAYIIITYFEGRSDMVFLWMTQHRLQGFGIAVYCLAFYRYACSTITHQILHFNGVFSVVHLHFNGDFLHHHSLFDRENKRVFLSNDAAKVLQINELCKYFYTYLHQIKVYYLLILHQIELKPIAAILALAWAKISCMAGRSLYVAWRMVIEFEFLFFHCVIIVR